MKAQHIILPLESGSPDETIIRSGIKLASAMQAKLTFLYVITSSNYAGYTGSMAVASMVSLKEQKDNIEDHYIETLRKYKSEIPSTMSIERSISEGPWISSVVGYANKDKADFLLLKHEEQGLIEKILGNSNTEIIHEAEIPVWIIPDKGTKEMPENIAYITDHKEGDIEAIRQILDLCELFNAKFYLIHVEEVNDFDALIKTEGFKLVLNKEFNNYKFKHLKISKGSIPNTMNDLIKEKGIDLLCMMNESKNFLTRFFNRSSVEKIIDSVDISLAIYA